jgi:predicted permease
MGELFRRIRYLIHRRRYDAELASDMEFHREMAARAGRRNFGNVLRMEEQAREAWGWTWLDDLMQDLRYALRVFAKSPGFAAVTILIMALGIGATTAIFSVVDATLIHPLPYPHAEELVRLEADLRGVGAHDVGFSVPEYRDLKSSGIFQYVAMIGGGSVNLTGSAEPARIQFEPVSPQYFSLLGVKPELGGTFDPNDQTPGFTLDVVISDGLWKRDFGSDPHIVGRSLRLDNDVYRVTGVMPRGFHDPGRNPEERSTDLWAGANFAGDPAPPPARSTRLTLGAIARLQPGLTVEAAQSRLDALVASLAKQYPADYPVESQWTIRMAPLSESVVGNVRPLLVLLLGAVGLVLLIGCTNVANLLLARASTRSREMAVRQALGAARNRLARQLLTESLLLSMAGGALGLATLAFTRTLLLRSIPESIPRLNDVSINWSVLLFALGISIAAGAVFGLAPIRLASRLDLNKALRQEGRGSTGSAGQARARRALVVTEFALSLVLMTAAGLLLRSFWQLFAVQLGFRTEHVMSVQTWLPVPNDPKTDIYGTATQEAVLVREILRRNRTLPGVEEAAVGDLAALPLGHGRDDLNIRPFVREGSDTRGKRPVVNTAIVSPEYFHLLGMTLLRGRLFSDQDIETTPAVAVINEVLARNFWPNEDPLGKRFRLNRPSWITVVGIIADARTESPEQAGIPQVYMSVYQRTAKDLAMFLRGQPDPGAIEAEVRRQVQSVDAQLPVFHAETLDDVLSDSLSARRFSLQMVGLFALTALLLAGLGIYGTISYLVAEQTREIGVRLALGADRRAILAMVLGQGLRLAIAGAGVGLAGAFIVSRLMMGLLYGVSPADPVTFVTVTVLLSIVAMAACYMPARRAMRVDALTALRYE